MTALAQEQSFRPTIDDIRQQLYDDVYERTNGVVQAGPFKGTQLYPDRGWPESNIAAELLGFFEQELQPDIEREIVRLGQMANPQIVNVGCAEGYYAVGLGRRIPQASIYAFDIDQRSLFIARKNAENNRVALADGPVEEAFAKADLIIMDCEGAEYDYLDINKHPHLKQTTIIVELHPQKDKPPLEQVLYERFGKTHMSRIIYEGERNPNVAKMLWGRSSFERWLAVCESRPCAMSWAVLRPKPAIFKECGTCTLCCKHERVQVLNKPKGQDCQHCTATGCAIHDSKPLVCRNFNCLWLTDETMPASTRPDRTGVYAYGAKENGYLNIVIENRVRTSPAYEIRDMINYVTKTLGLHAIVTEEASLRIVPADGQPLPEAIKLDWVLR